MTALLGITSPLFALALGVTAPPAAASTPVVLAPWVSCTDFWCRNETDDTYRVDVVVNCDFGVVHRTTAYLPAHRTTGVMGGCGSHREPCASNHDLPCTYDNPIRGIRYENVVIDNGAIPPWPANGTGSSS
ncbi:hypothetical protein GFY24_25115 [Nocardia sp. SYP-A9097]|nr:hypothetical protein [Nocardia sp. SYP-A9097]